MKKLPQTSRSVLPANAKPSDQVDTDQRYLTIQELARQSTLSVSTLRRLFRKGKIEGFQPGGPRSRILFPVDAIERMHTPNLEKPANPIPASPTVQRGPRPKWLQLDHGDDTALRGGIDAG